MSGPPSRDAGFVQQGQVDWVAFAKTTVPLSVEVLARIQGAGVQAITYAGVLQLATRFKLPELGRRRVWDTIEKLKVYNGASNLLYFGFNHRSLFRNLTETVSGLKCIALCSSLAEMHSEMVAARVLSALWQEVGYSEDYEPSYHQFLALVKVCGGALATSPFSEIARHMLPSRFDRLSQLQCSDPRDIAKALHGLFSISTGDKKAITVVGGSDCAFIAAVAHWIFDFVVFVEDENGNPVFVSSVAGRPAQPMSAQVHIKYAETAQPKTVITQSTFVLGDPEELFISTPDKQLLLLRRRIPWECCLRKVFGEAFADLWQLQTSLGLVFGSLARIRRALAEGEVEVGRHDREEYFDFAEASYGQGFIDSVERIFPELRSPDVERHMQSSLSLSFVDAHAQLERSLLEICRGCQCSRCPRRNPRNEGPITCLLGLTLTLFELLVMVSTIQFDIDGGVALQPTFEGLRTLNVGIQTSMEKVTRDVIMERCDPVFQRWRRPHWVSRMQRLTRMLEDVLLIFAGPDYQGAGIFGGYGEGGQRPMKPRTAICRSGICVFIEGLTMMTTRADLLRRIHVIPGRIAQLNQRSTHAAARDYDAVLDIANWPVPTLESVNTIQISPDPTMRLPVRQGGNVPVAGQVSAHDENVYDHAWLPQGASITAEVVEPEEVGEIMFYYRVSTAKGDAIIPPGQATVNVLAGTGSVGCDGLRCTGAIRLEDTSVLKVKAGWAVQRCLATEMRESRAVCFDWTGPRMSDVGRLVALGAIQEPTSGREGPEASFILHRHECMSCCMQQVLRLRTLCRNWYDDQQFVCHII
jgi:hypothetical protein